MVHVLLADVEAEFYVVRPLDPGRISRVLKYGVEILEIGVRVPVSRISADIELRQPPSGG